MTPLALIVDDDARNRRLARDVLGAAGFGTLEAGNGEEAIVLAGRRNPDVVLLDVHLPDLDGTEVARRLKADPATANIPVVALTALAGAGAALLESGFDGCVEKPIDVRVFPDQVRCYCRS